MFETSNSTHLVFEENITEIANSAYAENDKIKSIIFPKSLKKIGRSAFAHCSNLEEVVFTGESIELDAFAFFFCTKLKRVVLPKRVIIKSSGSAFSDCSKLSDINIPKYPFDDSLLYEDGGFIFHKTDWWHSFPHNFFIIGSTLIKAKTPKGANPNMEIPETVTKISKGAFSSTRVKRISFSDKVKEIGAGCFYSCSNLKEVVLPNGLLTIEENMFKDCKNLECVKIPSSVKQIKPLAFEDCGKVIIKAPKNSYAIAFAKECGIHFEEIDETCEDNIVNDLIDNSLCKQIVFGKYVQDVCAGAKKEPIVWDIIDESDDKMLIISHKCLVSRADYFGKAVRWSNCGIRQWLNNQFFKQAFSVKEKERIVETKLIGSSSIDKVFLLNSEEFNRLDKENKSARFSLLARKQYYEQNNCPEWNSLYAIWLLRPSKEFPTTFKIVMSRGYDQYVHKNEKWARGIRPAMWIKK